MSAELNAEEFALLRQAARNQSDDERRAAEAEQCLKCRSRAMDAASLRSRVREAALKKLMPKGCRLD